MHVMQSWFLGYMDGHSSHSPWLNHGCKIECLQRVNSTWLRKIGQVTSQPVFILSQNFGVLVGYFPLGLGSILHGLGLSV